MGRHRECRRWTFLKQDESITLPGYWPDVRGKRPDSPLESPIGAGKFVQEMKGEDWEG